LTSLKRLFSSNSRRSLRTAPEPCHESTRENLRLFIDDAERHRGQRPHDPGLGLAARHRQCPNAALIDLAPRHARDLVATRRRQQESPDERAECAARTSLSSFNSGEDLGTVFIAFFSSRFAFDASRSMPSRIR